MTTDKPSAGELKPCPFCGGMELNRFVHTTFNFNALIEVKKVQCNGCFAETSETSWNTRSPVAGAEVGVRAAAAQFIEKVAAAYADLGDATIYSGKHVSNILATQATRLRALSLPVAERDALCSKLRAMPSSLNDALRTMEEAAEFIERDGGGAQSAWRPIETAPKDGSWIAAICNDGTQIFHVYWDAAEEAWYGHQGAYGDGLFSPRGGWIPAPRPVSLASPTPETGDGSDAAHSSTERKQP